MNTHLDTYQIIQMKAIIASEVQGREEYGEEHGNPKIIDQVEKGPQNDK